MARPLGNRPRITDAGDEGDLGPFSDKEDWNVDNSRQTNRGTSAPADVHRPERVARGAAAVVSAGPAIAQAGSASEKLGVGIIGCGGRGRRAIGHVVARRERQR